MQNKSLSKRNIIINLAIILLVTGLLIFYLLKSQIVTAETVKMVKWYNYIVVFAIFFLGLIFVSAVDFFVYRTFTNSMPFGKCILNTVSGNLGSGITPFKSGHFPLMIYYQNRAGVSVSDTVTGLVKCQIIYSGTSIVVYTAVVTTLAIMGVNITFNGATVALWLVVSLGLIFHIGAFTAIVILAFNGKIQRFALTLWAKLLLKLKKIDSVNEYLLIQGQRLDIYRQQLTIIGKNTYRYILPCLLYVAHMFTMGCLQYISYLLISGASFSVSSLFLFYTFNLASGYITNIIPVPGGLGTSEVLFPLVFASVIPDAQIGAVLILWRVSSYYLSLIIDFLIFLPAVLIKKKKAVLDKIQ